jgi:glycosyltransferase involved in cell wall biosynthesis
MKQALDPPASRVSVRRPAGVRISPGAPISGASVPIPQILWLGPLQDPSGYAHEARGFLRCLERAGHAPVARDLVKQPSADAKLTSEESAMLRRQLRRADERVGVVVHHYAPTWGARQPVLRGVPNVARTMFETDQVPASWLPQLLTRDEIWVPCEHNRDSFERGGVPSSRLRVLGGTLDFDVFSPSAEPVDLGTPAGHLIFLSNFEFSARKAWRELLVAWARAFAPTDPVCLVLKTTADSSGLLAQRVEAAVADAARSAGRSGTAPVRLLARTVAHSELAGMYAAADAFVFASRGEGWGRPCMEALAMGLPTIASRWSGPVEFMRDETSWLVDGRLVSVPQENEVFRDAAVGHRWFEPDIEALSTALADIAADPERSRRRAAGARAELIQRFGPEATTRRLEMAISQVVDRARTFASGRECSIRGPFGRNASLALVNDRLLAELEAEGRRVTALPCGAATESLARPTISQSWPPDFSPGGDGPSVVVLHWEFGHPPLEWVERVRRDVDRVIVASEYVRQGYIAGGMPPGVVEVIPLGVDLSMFRPEGPALSLPRQASCVFMFVGGTIWRKGIDLLLAAWQLAFSSEDDVLLVVKDSGVNSHYQGQTHGDTIAELADRDDLAPIVYLQEEVPADNLPALYRAADVLVAPYRGEGFGLPILEAMACGVPAVHTGVGPSIEFVGADGGWAVPARRVSLGGRVDTMTLAGDGYVHEVDVQTLADTLRSAADDRDDRRRRAAAALARAQHYGWEKVGRHVEQSLSRLAAEGLELAREVRPARVDSRERTVLYAPDWRNEVAWTAALRRWVAAVPANGDVTLLMPVLDADAEAVMHRVMEWLESAGLDSKPLPDLAVHQQSNQDVCGLVAIADAVILDASQAGDPPPALWRRAHRVIRVGSREFDEYVAAVKPLTKSDEWAS